MIVFWIVLALIVGAVGGVVGVLAVMARGFRW